MTHQEYIEARALIDEADAIYGDLPDGAYWAACEEFGADMYLQIEVDKYEKAHGISLCENCWSMTKDINEHCTHCGLFKEKI